MKKPLPYRWLPQGHLETSEMTHEVHSCYRHLLDACWVHDGLPNDMAIIAQLAHYPLSEFQKQIWPKIEEFFYLDKDWKYKTIELWSEYKRLTNIRESQSQRARNKRRKPTVNRRLSPGKPAAKDADIVFGPFVPDDSPRIAPGLPPATKPTEIQTKLADEIADGYPADNPRLENNHIDEPLKAVGKPPVSPRLIESDSEKVKITTVEPADYYFEPPTAIPVNPVTNLSQDHVVISSQQNETNEPLVETKEPIHETETNLCDTPEPDFDQKLAWRTIARIYPNQSRTDEAKAFFMQEIVNQRLYHRFMKAVAKYRQRVPEPEAKLFYDWFWEWPEWEYPKEVV